MARKTRLDELQEACAKAQPPLYVRTYSPGDGVTRYRFFERPTNSYFGPENGVYTALGYKEACTFALGAGARF